MTMCRRFHGARTERLIVTVPSATVQAVDRLLASIHYPRRLCRAEFVRLAISEKLERDFSRPPKRRRAAT